MNKKFLSLISLVALALSLTACDSSSSPSQPKHQIDWASSNVINLTEVPQSCTSLVDKDSVFIDIKFQNWTWSEHEIFNGNNARGIQTFTGLEEFDLINFCNDAKNDMDEDIGFVKATNVSCNGNTIIQEVILSDEAKAQMSPAVFASSMTDMCRALLNGDITLRDVLYDD